MALVTEFGKGLTAFITGLDGAGTYQPFDATHAFIGVGDSATAYNIAQTNLQALGVAGTNRNFVAMDATYPQRAAAVMTFKSTFSTVQGNFHWQEWCVSNGSLDGITGLPTPPLLIMNRKVVDLGTKSSSATWVFTVTITIAIS